MKISSFISLLSFMFAGFGVVAWLIDKYADKISSQIKGAKTEIINALKPEKKEKKEEEG